MTELLTLKEASNWASGYLRKNITNSNISYLVQYGKIKRYTKMGVMSVDKSELIDYYKNYGREVNWKKKLGNDLNWTLSFDHLKEKDTTKHVHRLHPYKGKFIPQLAQYFLDDHTDEFKKHVYFKEGDIVLDPFSGSGTTMIQGNELGLHAIGIDISAFNVLMANVKVGKVNFSLLESEMSRMTSKLKIFISKNNNIAFENELLDELNIFNKQYFPSPEFKIKVRNKEITEKEYTPEKEREFEEKFYSLVDKHKLKLQQNTSNTFLDTWYLCPVRQEIDFMFEQLKTVNDTNTKRILTIILSRTIRSCRATTHADLATLKDPVINTYYCRKHGKICKPLFSILSWWERYCKDSFSRLYEFQKLKTNTIQHCVQGDARKIDILSSLQKKDMNFSEQVKQQKIKGVFSSPPYVGLINYHEQHAYAYDLFGFDRCDDLEIGPLFKGQGIEARKSYVEGVSGVLNNIKPYLQKDYDIFLVANDKYNIYPSIAEKSSMQIVKQYKRPVLNRTEKDKSAYAEIIFHLKEK